MKFRTDTIVLPSRLKRIIITAVGSIVAIMVLLPGVAIAQSSSGIGGRPAHPDPSNPRSKSIFVKTIEPGKSIEDEVEIINGSNETKTILIYATDSIASSDGAFACAQSNDPVSNTGRWLDIRTPTVTVPAGGSTIVPFTITAPNNAEPGEHNACIIIQEQKEQRIQGGIGLSFRTGIRVALLIPGEIKKELLPLGLTVTTASDKVVLTPQVKNIGTVSVDATIHTSLATIFSTTIASKDNVFPVLRDQLTKWNIELDSPFWGGLYRASFSIEYDENNTLIGTLAETSQLKTVQGQSRWVVIAPHPLALLIELITIAIIVFGVIRLHIFLRRRHSIKHHWGTHTVQTEQLQEIATQYHISWKQLARANNIKPPYQLKVGQIIKVPSSRSHAHPKSKKK